MSDSHLPSFPKSPSHTVRAGKICAKVWPNTDKAGKTWYSTTVVREWTDADGKTGTAVSFGKDDLLAVGEVLRQCWLWINDLPG